MSVDIGQSGPILSHFEQWDELREQHPAFWSDLYGGHWVITRFDAIRHALQEPTTFSNQSTIISDPNPEYTFIPTFLDPPEHGKYRTLYNARFSPGMVTRVSPAAREAANRYIDAFIDDGRCDFMTAFADPFPTDVFLNAINLPAEDTPLFVSWVHAVFGGLSGTDPQAGVRAQAEMRDYFKEHARQAAGRPAGPRRRHPDLPAVRRDRRPADPRGRPPQHGRRPRAGRPRHDEEPARLQLPLPRDTSRGAAAGWSTIRA